MDNFSDDFGGLNTYSRGDGKFSAQAYVEDYYQKIYRAVKPFNAIIYHHTPNKIINVDGVQWGERDNFMPKSRCNADTTDLDLMKNTLAAPRVVTYRFLSKRNFDPCTHEDLAFTNEFTEYEQHYGKLPKDADKITQSSPPVFPYYPSQRNARYFDGYERVDGNLSGLPLYNPEGIDYTQKSSIQNPILRDNAYKFKKYVSLS